MSQSTDSAKLYPHQQEIPDRVKGRKLVVECPVGMGKTPPTTLETVIHYQGQHRFFDSWYPYKVQAVPLQHPSPHEVVIEIDYCDHEDYPGEEGYHWTAWRVDWSMACYEGPFETKEAAQASIRLWVKQQGGNLSIFNTEE